MRRYRNNKYGNIINEYEGITFHSIKERNRYAELKMLEKAGAIQDLKLQQEFVLQKGYRHGKTGKWVKPITYKCDFCYLRGGEFVIEDVKSEATRKDAVYRLKKKMMEYKGSYITEV